MALEAHRLWQRSAGQTTQLAGVRARESDVGGMGVTTVEILDERGAKALGKPVGRYITVDVSPLWRREEGAFRRGCETLAELLSPMLPEGPVLVAGLGNAAMTPDALGPMALDHLLVTRHLSRALPGLRPVSALAAGVLGSTGLEAAEWVRGAAGEVEPKAVIVIDALAGREAAGLCGSVQLSDTGLIPGSGVGNHRAALNREGLGVPVLSVGVPTVTEVTAGEGRKLFVTPESIDEKMRLLGKLLGYGLSLALQPGLTWDDLDALLA
jgi:spore protease